MFEIVAKKFLRLSDIIEFAKQASNDSDPSQKDDLKDDQEILETHNDLFDLKTDRSRSSISELKQSSVEIQVQHLKTYSDVVALFMEMINSVVINNITTNVQLIYSSLQYKEIFLEFHKYDRFKILSENITKMITFFQINIEPELEFSDFERLIELIQYHSFKFIAMNEIDILEDISFEIVDRDSSGSFFLPCIRKCLLDSSYNLRTSL
jgi:hypothetical protein